MQKSLVKKLSQKSVYRILCMIFKRLNKKDIKEMTCGEKRLSV